MTKTHDVTTDGRNGFTMYFNKFMIYKEIATKMGQTVMRRTTSDNVCTCINMDVYMYKHV